MKGLIPALYDTVIVRVTAPNSDEQLLKHGDKPFTRIVETVSAAHGRSAPGRARFTEEIGYPAT